MRSVLLVLRDARFISFSFGLTAEDLMAMRRRVAEIAGDGWYTDHGRNPVILAIVEAPDAWPFQYDADAIAGWARE